MPDGLLVSCPLVPFTVLLVVFCYCLRAGQLSVGVFDCASPSVSSLLEIWTAVRVKLSTCSKQVDKAIVWESLMAVTNTHK